MTDTKKENVAATTFSRSDILTRLSQLYSDITVLQNIRKGKDDQSKSGGRERNKKSGMAYNSVVKTLNLKFYAEQLLTEYMTDDELYLYWQYLNKNYNYMLTHPKAKTMAKTDGHLLDFLFDDLKERVENFDSSFQVAFIVHDADKKADADDYFKLSSIKPHAHMVIKKRNNRAFRMNTIMKALGINFRRYIDNDLWKQGVATCWNFAHSVAYLTHETDKAQADGKTIYSRDRIISNCPSSEIDDFREGYLIANEKRKLTNQELAKLDKQFFDYGYSLKNFDDLYNSLDFIARSNSKMRTIKESYQRGVDERLKKEPPEVNRVCLFIEGPPNTGKTYAVNNALKALGHKVFEVTGGGSGKFDNLSITDTAITIDDEVCPNLLNMTDSRITTAYKRNSNNPYWTGSMFVVTSNKPFLSWCNDSGLRVFGFTKNSFNENSLNEHGNAMLSRFILCEVVDYGDYFQIVSNTDFTHLRGTAEEKQDKINRAMELIKIANSIMKDYTKKSSNDDFEVDFSVYLNGEECKISDLKKEYNEVFAPLWKSLNPDKDFATIAFDFDSWLKNGASNSYDKKVGFFRK